MADRDKIVGLRSTEQAIPRAAPTGFAGEGSLHDAVRDLLTTYHDLNPATIDELYEDPSPLEFLRFVHRNRPFVIRKAADSFPAHKRWGADYLTSVLGEHAVNVAITPHGNADSIVQLSTHPDNGTEGGMLFVKPLERSEPFSSVIQKIQDEERDPSYVGPTRYAQTQNDNLRNEYRELFSDVPSSISFARIALEAEPDAINFWLGNSKSTTALHKDNYENIYVQVLGRKHFVLLPPVEAPCVNEKAALAATYKWRHAEDSDHDGGQEEITKEDLEICIDGDGSGNEYEYVPFATWDPDSPATNATPFSQFSQPLKVTLDEGDILYLPALWYHKVSQSCNHEGLCCAVNYWYDLDFSGGFWATSSFVRGAGLLAQREDGGQR